MKTNKIFAAFLFAFMVTVSFISCQKQGPPGPKGDPGNANVKSKEYTVAWNGWANDGPDAIYTVLNTPHVTQEIVNTGTVNVDVKIISGSSSTNWTALPLSVTDTEIYYEYEKDRVKIWITMGDGSNIAPHSGLSTMVFKVTAIAGTAARKNLNP